MQAMCNSCFGIADSGVRSSVTEINGFALANFYTNCSCLSSVPTYLPSSASSRNSTNFGAYCSESVN